MPRNVTRRLLRRARARVRAAFFAAAERDAAERRRAAERACRASASRETVFRGSPFNFLSDARARFAEGLRCDLPARAALAADFFVLSLALFGGAGSLTPARRAFDNPIAIACFVERAPCLPSRTCSISSCTNSPAWVLGALPWRSGPGGRVRWFLVPA